MLIFAKLLENLSRCYYPRPDLDSVIGIETRYGLDDLGITFRLGRDFPHPSRPSLGPTQSPRQGVPDLFPRGEAAEGWL
jgi:hypothetical protein